MEQSLEILRTSQAQLIQQEKLAYFGQLAGGITHKIQNPLKFGNKFPDIKADLSDENPCIPESTKAKIFQPFLTTKPHGAGYGTGTRSGL